MRPTGNDGSNMLLNEECEAHLKECCHNAHNVCFFLQPAVNEILEEKTDLPNK